MFHYSDTMEHERTVQKRSEMLIKTHESRYRIVGDIIVAVTFDSCFRNLEDATTVLSPFRLSPIGIAYIRSSHVVVRSETAIYTRH